MRTNKLTAFRVKIVKLTLNKHKKQHQSCNECCMSELIQDKKKLYEFVRIMRITNDKIIIKTIDANKRNRRIFNLKWQEKKNNQQLNIHEPVHLP